MKFFHVGVFFFFSISFFIVPLQSMNVVDQMTACLCGRSHADSSAIAPTDSTLMTVHNPRDVRQLLYDVLDPMPMDLITIILGYDASDVELKGTCVSSYKVSSNWVQCLLLLDDKIVVCGLHSGVLLLYSLKSGKIITKIAAHRGPIFALGVLLNNWLFSVSQDKKIRYWDLSSNVELVKQEAMVVDDENTKVQQHTMARMAAELITSNLFFGSITLTDPKKGLFIGVIVVPRDTTHANNYSNDDVRLLHVLTSIMERPLVLTLQYIQGALVASENEGKALLAKIEATQAQKTPAELDRTDENVIEGVPLYDCDVHKITGLLKIGFFRWLIKVAKNVWVSDDVTDLHQIKVWNCKTGTCTMLLALDQPLRTMAPLPNGLLAVGLGGNTSPIRLVDPRTTMTVSKFDNNAFIKGFQPLAYGGLISYGSEGFKLWS